MLGQRIAGLWDWEGNDGFTVAGAKRVVQAQGFRSAVHTERGDSGWLVKAPMREGGDQALDSLVARAQRGDRSAASELLESLTPPLRRFLRRILHAGEDLEDALQESLIALLKALPGFRGEAGLLHFAVEVARRTALSSRRKIKRHENHMLRVAEWELALPRESPVPYESAVGRRRRAELEALLSELSDAQAEAVVLAILYDYPLAEVANKAAVPVNTVRTRLRRARKWLRSRIEVDSALADLLRD